jgi:hypothetical protein
MNSAMFKMVRVNRYRHIELLNEAEGRNGTMQTFSHSSSLWPHRQQCRKYRLLKLLGQGGFAVVYLGLLSDFGIAIVVQPEPTACFCTQPQ